MSRHALLIGTTQYQDPLFSQLTAPAADIEELHAVLSSSEVGGFDAASPILNEQSYTINRELENFFQDRQRDALLLLYFSGHGVLDDHGRLYLAATNTERRRLRSTAVEASFVRDLMDQCRAEKQILILDCCHSGAFGRTKNAIGESVGTDLAFGGQGRIVLTASNATQFAFEGNEVLGAAKTSLFTHFLLQGLRTGDADLDGDGHISIDELYAYANDQVIRHTTAQTPCKWAFRQQGDVIIARNTRPRSRPGVISAELLRGLTSTERAIQRGALEGLAELLRDPSPERAAAARGKLAALACHDSQFIAEAATRILVADHASWRPGAEPLSNQGGLAESMYVKSELDTKWLEDRTRAAMDTGVRFAPKATGEPGRNGEESDQGKSPLDSAELPFAVRMDQSEEIGDPLTTATSAAPTEAEVALGRSSGLATNSDGRGTSSSLDQVAASVRGEYTQDEPTPSGVESALGARPVTHALDRELGVAHSTSGERREEALDPSKIPLQPLDSPSIWLADEVHSGDGEYTRNTAEQKSKPTSVASQK
jgi:hypothetical protein